MVESSWGGYWFRQFLRLTSLSNDRKRQAYQELLTTFHPTTTEPLPAGSYNVLIVRGIFPSLTIPQFPEESILWTKIGDELGIHVPIHEMVTMLDREKLLLVCGDAYEDAVAQELQTRYGFKCYTKNREALLKKGHRPDELAQEDFRLCIYAQRVIGPIGSSLRLASKDARWHLGLTNEPLSVDEWKVWHAITQPDRMRALPPLKHLLGTYM